MIRPVLVCGLIPGLLGGCMRSVERWEVMPDPVRTETELRTATNLPAQFQVVTPAAAAGDCPPRLRDDLLRTNLVLHRSVLAPAPDSAGSRAYRALGDYAAEPAGRYGEEPGEGLRVDCARLRALGVVKL